MVGKGSFSCGVALEGSLERNEELGLGKAGEDFSGRRNRKCIAYLFFSFRWKLLISEPSVLLLSGLYDETDLLWESTPPLTPTPAPTTGQRSF